MRDFVAKIGTWFVDLIEGLKAQTDTILLSAVKVILIIILARFLISIFHKAGKRLIESGKRKRPSSEFVKKSDTLSTILYSAIKFIIYFFAIMAILQVIGLGQAAISLLATAGIGGIAIAFGAQGLIKDVMTGMFFLFEDQYAVGEFVELNGEQGMVEAITIRTTQIKHLSGEVTTIPNGNIQKITNFSRSNSLAIIDAIVSIKMSLEQIRKIMLGAVDDYKKTHKNIKASPEFLGIIRLGQSDMTIRMTIQTKALTHWETEREIRKRIVQQLNENDFSGK